MNGSLPLWAQATAVPPGSRVTWEFGRENWTGLLVIGILTVLVVGWMYRRDARELAWYWKTWLFLLRLGALIGLVIVALDPQERTETSLVRPSKVAVLVDGSVSMSFPELALTGTSAPQGSTRSRAEAIEELLAKTPVLAKLRETHDLSFYRFDSRLQSLQHLARIVPGQPAEEGTADSPPPDWKTLVAPTGLETRLGESLGELIREAAGETLSGIVILTDGQSNAGLDVETAREAAIAAKVRLIPVGVGSVDRPVNVLIGSVQAPTHVHKGDGFTITAFVQGQGLVGKSVQVELLSKLESDPSPPSVIDKHEATLLEDGVPVAVAFDYQPVEAGRRIFNVRVVPTDSIAELTVDDNEKPLPPVEISERKTRVLVVAGGPMRDYQFVRNLFYRDPGIELDIWLQTGRAGISQESNQLLAEFPTDEASLFSYDVVLAFDPNWEQIPPAGRESLAKWVYQQAGGLVVVAGDIYTSALARSGPEFQPIRDLLPVVLRPSLLELDLGTQDFQQPWPIDFTREGTNAEFLQVDDNATTSADVWKQFPGIYRCQLTAGAKPGATVYAYFGDRRSEDEHGKTILLAGQFFGAGRVLYLGSAETWRLRAIDEKYYERLWIKLLREVGQGRLLRGTNRGVLLLERQTYPLGSSIAVRANLLDQQFKEYLAPQVSLELVDPQGKRAVPPLTLMADRTRPGQYQGNFTAYLPGRYRLELPIPESTEQVVSYIQVEIPNLEYEHPEQNVPLLQQLATTELGGKYLPLASAAAELPDLLPDRSTTKIQFDVPKPLWDREWVLYLLVGLLSAEWLTRKLLKLA